MRRKLPLVIMVMLLPAIAASGCGDDEGASAGSSESLPVSSLSTEQYVERASAACSKRRSKLLPEMTAYLGGEEAAKEFTPDKFGPVLRKVVVPVFEDEVAIIRKLGAPEGDEEEIEAILAGQEAGIDELKKLKDPRSFADIAKHFTATTKTMEQYGFTACVNS